MNELHLQPGPLLGKTLEYLLEQVIENPNLNGKEELTALAQKFIEGQNA